MARWDLGTIASSGAGGGLVLTGYTSFNSFSYGSGYVSIQPGYDENYNNLQLPAELGQLAENSVVSFLNTDKYGFNINGMQLTITMLNYSSAGNYCTFDYVVSSADESLHDSWISTYPSFSGVDTGGYDTLELVI